MGTCTAAKREIARTLVATRKPCQHFKKGIGPTKPLRLMFPPKTLNNVPIGDRLRRLSFAKDL
jgi:hypothetical protein